MQISFTRDLVVRMRGADCLLFQVITPSLPSRNGSSSRELCARKASPDVVFVAEKMSLPFWMRFSQTVLIRSSLAGHTSPRTSPWSASNIPATPDQSKPLSNSSRRLEWLVQIVERFTITCLGHSSVIWRYFSLADAPKMLSQEQMEPFVQKVSIRVPAPTEIIMVSKDRATLVFSQWKDRINSRSAWHTPFALSISLGATLLTASFTDQTWMKAGTIKGIFATVLLLSLAWLIHEFWEAYRNRGLSAERFIEELASGSQRIETTSTEKSTAGESI